MKTNYLLVDYENVQPQGLEALRAHPVRIVVFVGANQTRLPTEFATSMQQLGSAAQYVRVSGSGRNALDFHIAYTLGRLVTLEPDARFHLISKDRGFDPLLSHLVSQGVVAERVSAIADVSFFRAATSGTRADQVAAIVANLRSRGTSRPRKLKTLSSTIGALFRQALDDADVAGLIEALTCAGYITLDGETVRYHLPP